MADGTNKEIDHQNKWSWMKHYHHFICKLGDEEVIVGLLKTGADINVRNSTLRTVVFWLHKEEHKPELVSMLLTYRAAPDKGLDIDGKVTKRMAVTLLRHGFSSNAPGEVTEVSNLELTLNSQDIARMLVECGAALGPKTLSVMPALLFRSTKTDPDFYDGLKAQLAAPFSLKSLSAQAIRMHLAETHNRSILEHLTKLPLPKTLIEYLALDRYVG